MGREREEKGVVDSDRDGSRGNTGRNCLREMVSAKGDSLVVDGDNRRVRTGKRAMGMTIATGRQLGGEMEKTKGESCRDHGEWAMRRQKGIAESRGGGAKETRGIGEKEIDFNLGGERKT